MEEFLSEYGATIVEVTSGAVILGIIFNSMLPTINNMTSILINYLF